MLLCATIVIFAILYAYYKTCIADGFLSSREIKTIAEYFFICITEILFLSLGFDIVYKYEKGNRES